MGKYLTKRRRAAGQTAAGNVAGSPDRPHISPVAGELSSRKRRTESESGVAAAVSLITFFVYLATLRNGFVFWDDDTYIYDNPHIHSLDSTFFKWAFSDFYAGNWHPLTWISHALDYALWGLNPLGHHLTNNILHAINTFLVVVLVTGLLKIWKEGTSAGTSSFPGDRAALITGGVTGLLFGLHPLHVESVAWLAERKDLLCALFYLLSIKSYLQYARPAAIESMREEGNLRYSQRHYFFALCFFILALLSKPMAVTLPAVLLILDWYPLLRMQTFKSAFSVFLEKIPFITASVVVSVITVSAQKAGGALSMVAMAVTPLPQRAALAAESLVSYLGKMVLPLDLIPLYPYPDRIAPLSPEYLVPSVLVVGMTIICIFLARKQKLWLAVWSYYVITLIPVLGLVQVGIQSMADRYTYLPSLGPFLAAGLLASWISGKVSSVKERRRLVKVVSAAAALLIAVSLSYLTFEQIGIWRSRLDLWTHVIEKEPGKVSVAYGNRGDCFFEMGDLDRALADYNKAIALDRFYTGIYYERGLLFAKMGQFGKAIADYDSAIVLDQSGAPSNISRESYFLSRGEAYLETGRQELAISDLAKACELGSDAACQTLKHLPPVGTE